MFDEAERIRGGVDVLVNNAGIMKLAPFDPTDDLLFDRHIALNLKRVFNGMLEAARRFKSGGRIISFSDRNAPTTEPS